MDIKHVRELKNSKIHRDNEGASWLCAGGILPEEDEIRGLGCLRADNLYSIVGRHDN